MAAPYFSHRAELYDRYRRKSDPNTLMSAKGDRTAMCYENYIVSMASGYLAGKPPTYTVTANAETDEEKDAVTEQAEKYQDEIDHIRRYNDDGATFAELIKDYLIKTAAYLYVYEDNNNEIVYAYRNSLNTIVIYDTGTPPYPVAMLYTWTERDEKNNDIKKIEIITGPSDDKEKPGLRRIFTSDGEPVQFADYVIPVDENGNETGKAVRKIITEKKLNWDDVPVIAFEEPDGIAIFEPALSQIDFIETVMTNIRKTAKYNDEAKLKISGYHPENQMIVDVLDADGSPIINTDGTIRRIVNPAWKQEEKELYEASAIFINEPGGDVQWLLKSVDYSGALSIMKYADSSITMLTGVPNMTDESFSGVASGVALGYKLYSLDQNAAVIDRVFKRGYLRLWEIVTNRLNLKNDTDYDFRDIDIGFLRNIPTDKDMAINRASTLYAAGIVSLETAINITGLDIDAESEVQRIAAEKLKIKTIREIREALTSDPPLMDLETALSLIYNEDEAKRLLPILKREMADRAAYGMATASEY